MKPVVITPEEIRGMSPGQLITHYINRVNGTDFQPSQLDFEESEFDEFEGDPVIKVRVRPRPKTGWTHGPLHVVLPVINVGEFYKDFQIVLNYTDLQGPEPIATLIRAAGGPPSRPLEIRQHSLDQKGGKYLTVSYEADYANVFFTGTLPLVVKGAPNNLKALQQLNRRMLMVSTPSSTV